MIKRFLLACIFFTPYLLHAESLTTNSLILNGNFESGNLNHWTTEGDVAVFNDCCSLNNSTKDVEIGKSGSLSQSFTLISDNITQPMLDNNPTELVSTLNVQNGECTGTGCWAGSGRGGYDSFTVRLQFRDSDNNVLATTSNTRTDPTAILGSTFTDQLIYSGTGASIGNIKLSGYDAAQENGYGGVNFDDIEVVLNYNSEYVTEVQAAAITESVEELNEVLELFEEVIPEEIITETIYIQEFEELAVEILEENFAQIQIEEAIAIEEEIILAVMEPEPQIIEPEIVEELTTEVEEIESIEEEIYAESVEPETTSETEEVEQAGSTELNSEPGTDNPEEIETSENENDSRSSKVTVTIDDIADKVASKIQDVNKRVAVTQMIVAKIMMGKNNNAITTYSQFGNEIFENQLEIPQMSLTNEYTKDLEKDDRVIASPVFYEYRQEVDQANADLIRAKEHLRNIRGY